MIKVLFVSCFYVNYSDTNNMLSNVNINVDKC